MLSVPDALRAEKGFALAVARRIRGGIREEIDSENMIGLTVQETADGDVRWGVGGDHQDGEVLQQIGAPIAVRRTVIRGNAVVAQINPQTAVVENGVGPNGIPGSRSDKHTVANVPSNDVGLAGIFAADRVARSGTGDLNSMRAVLQANVKNIVRADDVSLDHIVGGAAAGERDAFTIVAGNEIPFPGE